MENTGLHITGTCHLMCPLSEIRMREHHGLLHKYEIIKGTESLRRPRADRKKAVKEYRRPAAGRENPSPSELRPDNILLKTTHYLFDNVCIKQKLTVSAVYEFVFDRLRAVRQDMVMQDIYSTSIVKVLECCVRFHIYYQYRLCEASPVEYDQKINTTHALECLKRLLCLYDTHQDICTCDVGEFLTLYLLFNLGDIDAIQLALEHKDRLKNLNLLKHDVDFNLALSISFAWINTNYTRVFKLADQLSSPLGLCALQRHLPAMYCRTLAIMTSGYNSKTLGYSLDDLKDLLFLDSSLICKKLCEDVGLKLKDENHVIFSKASFKDINIPPRRCKWIDNKLINVEVNKLLKGESCSCFIDSETRDKKN